MISLYLAMQNAILTKNIAQSQMIQSSNQMLNSLSFGNSQPLRPSFAKADMLELSNKANETKISVLSRLIEAYEKTLGKKIKSSVPKYCGLNYKA